MGESLLNRPEKIEKGWTPVGKSRCGDSAGAGPGDETGSSASSPRPVAALLRSDRPEPRTYPSPTGTAMDNTEAVSRWPDHTATI